MKNVKDYGALVAVVVFTIGLVASAAVGQYQIRSNVTEIQKNAVQQRKDARDFRAAQMLDHDSIIRIEVDVRWIRESLEKQE